MAEPVEVVPGVFVIPDERVPIVPNVGVIVGERFALVVDTAMGPRDGALTRATAQRLAPGRRLLLTFTHFHPEHAFGAQAFLPEATVIFNRALREEYSGKAAGYLEMFRGFGEDLAVTLEGVEFIEPDIVFDGRLEIDLGGRIVELRAVGPAHTLGDQIVFVPEGRVLFAGDLVEDRIFPMFPYFPPDDVDADGDNWIATLERFDQLEPAVVVPGHGEISDSSLVATELAYLRLLRSETHRLAGEGKDADASVAEIERAMRGVHPDWDQADWLGLGVRVFHDSWARAQR